MAESFIVEMKRYLGIGPEQERLLIELGPRMEKHLPELAERFYSQIPHHPNASRVFSDELQIERLKQTLQQWARRLFRGGYDEAYSEERFRIGYRHVRVGLDQRYVISAMSIVRSFLIQCLAREVGDERRRQEFGAALNKILDLDLNLMCESYMFATLDDLRRLNADLEDVNRKLEEASHAKDIFLSHVSHELRTPLNSILGFTKLILDGLGGTPEEERELLQDVFVSAQHLLELVNDLLDIRRIEEGKLSLRIENVSLRQVIDASLPLIVMEAGEKKIEVRDETIGMEMPTAWADEMRVRQVLLNLLYNAVKFTPAGAITVRVRTLERGSGDFGMIRVEVEDTGSGIPGDMRERVFSEFVQLGDPATQKFRGAGLGLAISRRLVALMGGNIGLEAGANNRGTLAWFTLPQANSSAQLGTTLHSESTR